MFSFFFLPLQYGNYFQHARCFALLLIYVNTVITPQRKRLFAAALQSFVLTENHVIRLFKAHCVKWLQASFYKSHFPYQNVWPEYEIMLLHGTYTTEPTHTCMEDGGFWCNWSGFWILICQINFRKSDFTNNLKEQFTPKSKIHIFPIKCGAIHLFIYLSWLFWCELPTFWGIAHRNVCLL